MALEAFFATEPAGLVCVHTDIQHSRYTAYSISTVLPEETKESEKGEQEKEVNFRLLQAA